MRPMYSLPEDDLAGEVIIPAMARSSAVRCMAGFFNSAAFRHIAPGLAAFINDQAGSFRLLTSPVLSAEDQRALREATETPQQVLARAATNLFESARLSSSALEHHTVDCLAYLLAAGRLEFRVALMRAGGMFHPKVWLFEAGADLMAAHGSSNPTSSGLSLNYEIVAVERGWSTEESASRTQALARLFNTLWAGEADSVVTLDVTPALSFLVTPGQRQPTVEDFWRAWQADAAIGLAPPLPVGGIPLPPVQDLPLTDTLRIPDGTEWQTGRFAHQARAVAAWEAAKGRGLLSMATGSGKTVTSLICATRLLEREGHLLVIIAAPYRPLVEQWSADVRRFGVTPLPAGAASASERAEGLREAVRRLDRGVSRVEVAVLTHEFLVSDEMHELLETIPRSVPLLLIADEVHNLGRPRFVRRPPHPFQYRIGLSATPVLQYNEAGSEAIAAFFGKTVFEFDLAEAIGVCLVPYNYYLHPVAMSVEELERWEELTARLIRAGFSGRDDGGADGSLSPEVMALLVKRRAVLETAAAKIERLMELVLEQGIDEIRHTLVYCSDKNPDQLRAVNQRLLSTGLFVRQLTDAESGDRGKTAQILGDFGRGDYQVLTCKRVLDEGVDIPQVRQAFLLASSTVRRQWIQRRGRVLRRCDEVGKDLAYLHDFIVVPPDPQSASGRAILRQEFERGRAFAELAANSGSPDGPFATMAGVAPPH